METIKVLKLKRSGDNIVCYLDTISDKYIIRDPFLVYVNTDYKTGKQSISMDFWLPDAIIKSNEVCIPCSEFIVEMTPSDEFKEYYENAVSTIKKHLKKQNELEATELSFTEEEELSEEELKLMLELANPGKTKFIN